MNENDISSDVHKILTDVMMLKSKVENMVTMEREYIKNKKPHPFKMTTEIISILEQAKPLKLKSSEIYKILCNKKEFASESSFKTTLSRLVAKSAVKKSKRTYSVG